jgi:hypothetical protein
MLNDDEPVFDATVSNLKGQRGFFASSSGHLRWRWGMVMLLLALLVGGELFWAARPFFSQSHTEQATPLPTWTAAPTPTSPPVFSSLAVRPLHFPAVASLATCPVSLGRQISPDFGLAAGTGPLYIIGVAADGTIPYLQASRWGDTLGWGGMPKTLWVFTSRFSGPVLVRGQRLDAGGSIRFNAVSGPLLSQLHITVPTGPASMPYQEYGAWYIRFNAPGCYGLQVDWPNGTEHIVVRTQA